MIRPRLACGPRRLEAVGSLERVSPGPALRRRARRGRGARRAARQGLGVALATSAYGISFGALVGGGGTRRLADLRPEPADVHRRIAVRLRRRDRRRAGSPRRPPRSRPRRSSASATPPTACGCRPSSAEVSGSAPPPRSSRSTSPRRSRWRSAPAHARLVGFWVTGSRSTSAGTSPLSPARSSATCSETRGRTDWMPRPRPPSSPCSGRACARRQADRGRCRGGGRGDDAHPAAHARASRCSSPRRRDRRRLVQLARGVGIARRPSRATSPEREGLP